MSAAEVTAHLQQVEGWSVAGAIEKTFALRITTTRWPL